MVVDLVVVVEEDHQRRKAHHPLVRLELCDFCALASPSGRRMKNNISNVLHVTDVSDKKGFSVFHPSAELCFLCKITLRNSSAFGSDTQQLDSRDDHSGPLCADGAMIV